MKGIKKGTELELKDGSSVAIESISISKQQITISENREGEVSTHTYSLEDFQSLLHPSALPDEGLSPLGVGLKFQDADMAISEIVQVKEEKIFYKKRYGSESWESSTSIDEFEESFKKGKIVLF